MNHLQKKTSKPKSRIRTAIERMGAIVVALIFWQLAAMQVHQKILLVTAGDVAKRLITLCMEPDFLKIVGFTFGHIWSGFAIGLSVGIALAVLAWRWPLAETLLWPWMATIKSVPVASLIVILLIWLSTRDLPVFISFLVVTPVVYQNLLTGLQSCDVAMEEVSEVFELPLYVKLRYITLPQIRPYLMSACTLTVGMAWKAGVAAEIIATPSGSIGKMIYLAKIYLNTDELLAWVVLIVVLSTVSGKLFLKLLTGLLRH